MKKIKDLEELGEAVKVAEEETPKVVNRNHVDSNLQPKRSRKRFIKGGLKQFRK